MSAALAAETVTIERVTETRLPQGDPQITLRTSIPARQIPACDLAAAAGMNGSYWDRTIQHDLDDPYLVRVTLHRD